MLNNADCETGGYIREELHRLRSDTEWVQLNIPSFCF